MFPWEEYRSNLYVERKEFTDLLTWINSSPVQKQVKSLVAAPGTGKSWFLKAVPGKLKQTRVHHSPASPERLVIFCDAPSLVNREQITGAILNQDAVFKWLEEIIQDALPIYPTVDSIAIDRDREIAAITGDLANVFCAERSQKPTVVVLVDGLDDIPDQASVVENQILEPFIGKECIRMVVAHRDEYGLKSYTLRRNNGEQARLPLSPLPSADEQFKKFKDECHPSATHLTTAVLGQFMQSLKRYRWNHPYINAFLFDVALMRPDSDIAHLLTTDDLRVCLFAVAERRDESDKPRFGSLSPNAFNYLKCIASELKDGANGEPKIDWTLTDLEKQLGIKEDSYLKQLFDFGIAFYNPQTKRYQLADGIRELACDLVERGG